MGFGKLPPRWFFKWLIAAIVWGLITHVAAGEMQYGRQLGLSHKMGISPEKAEELFPLPVLERISLHLAMFGPFLGVFSGWLINRGHDTRRRRALAALVGVMVWIGWTAVFIIPMALDKLPALPSTFQPATMPA